MISMLEVAHSSTARAEQSRGGANRSVHAAQAEDGEIFATIAGGFVERFPALDLFERLAAIRAEIPGRVVFTTSFGLEDQAIAHAIFAQALAIDVATLDTGRLFPETYDVWARDRAALRRPRPGLRARTPRRRSLDRRTRHRWVPILRRGSPRLLRGSQGRAVGAGARRCRRLDHRAARRSVRRPRAGTACSVRRRARSDQGQSAVRLDARTHARIRARPRRAMQCAA